MPSTYAHYRLGQQVRRELEGNERKIIEKYPVREVRSDTAVDIFQ